MEFVASREMYRSHSSERVCGNHFAVTCRGCPLGYKDVYYNEVVKDGTGRSW